MILDIVDTSNPILKQKMERFDFAQPQTDPIELAHNLTQTMIHNNGLSLSANHVGLPYRAFVIMSNPVICCFNPRIVDETNETVYLEETSLIYPGLSVKIRRPSNIKVRYEQPNGDVATNKYIGMTSRLIQQELDHLNGILFYTKASAYHLEQAKKKRKKLYGNKN